MIYFEIGKKNVTERLEGNGLDLLTELMLVIKAFKEEDWAKVIRYVNKYQPHWKPSEIDMKYLDLAIVLAEADKSYNLADGLKRLKGNLKKL